MGGTGLNGAGDGGDDRDARDDTAARTVREVYRDVLRRDPHQKQYTDGVREVLGGLAPVLVEHPALAETLARICEPERQVVFRVPWVDDQGRARVNRGFRVQFSSALGPYKGGLRFAPSLDLDVVKFLAFEQVFKNALTGLELGAGKGGSDFVTKAASDGEVMRFCQSFITELHRHIGAWTDVPAGDMGVGPRELGWMLGQYQRLAGRHESGVLTGKPAAVGGSAARSEATGYGVVYFLRRMLDVCGRDLDGARVVVSGAGNVARHAMDKVVECGATVVGCSDSTGALHDDGGIDLDLLREVKDERRGTVADYAERRSSATVTRGSPFEIACDVALPCATQNELDVDGARALVKQGCWAVAEGANGPTTGPALRVLREAGVLYGPGKAANAGGVAVSGLEMQQNTAWQHWAAQEVDTRLATVMEDIHDRVRAAAGHYHGDETDYEHGANAAGFLRVAEAVATLGVV